MYLRCTSVYLRYLRGTEVQLRGTSEVHSEVHGGTGCTSAYLLTRAVYLQVHPEYLRNTSVRTLVSKIVPPYLRGGTSGQQKGLQTRVRGIVNTSRRYNPVPPAAIFVPPKRP